MKTIVKVSIHVGRSNSFQSGDFGGYREFTSKKLAEDFIKVLI